MASSINVNSSSGTSTDNTTANPQSGGQVNSVSGNPQNPQSAVSSSSINTQSSGSTIALQPTSSLSTAPIHPTSSSHKISTTSMVIVALLVIVAIGSCLYIYISSKKAVKNT